MTSSQLEFETSSTGQLRPLLLRLNSGRHEPSPLRSVCGELVRHHQLLPLLHRRGDDDDSLRLCHDHRLKRRGRSDPY
ncbi:hypothetical protein ACSBR2_026423 [Camellia fascicularis]